MHIAGQQYEAGDQDSRGKILELCKQLTSELEQPGETFMRINWAEVILPFSMPFLPTAPDGLLAYTFDRTASCT